MSSIGIMSHNMGAGLHKARADECRDIFAYYAAKIQEEPLTYPDHVQEWRRGSFSWVFVRGVEYWTLQLFYTLESVAMAGKRNGKNRSRSLDAYSFVRCELNSEDKKAAKIWIAENINDIGPMLHDVVAEDYKFSLSYSQDHGTFTATLTGKEGAVNEFKTLTARHNDWITAAMTVLFKHGVMFKSNVWESEDSEDDGWA